MDGAAIIAAYHDLWQVEKSFRMSKTDLRARPIFHHQRDTIEAHLTVVFAALAVSRYLQDLTGVSISKLVRTLRTVRSATVRINGTEISLDPEIPQAARDILSSSGQQVTNQLARLRSEGRAPAPARPSGAPPSPPSVLPLDGPQLARRTIDQSDPVEPSVQRQYVVDRRGQHRQLRQGRTRSHRTMRQPSAGTVVLVQLRTGRGDRLHDPFLSCVQLDTATRQQPGPPPPEQANTVKTELNRRKTANPEQGRRDFSQIPTPQDRV
jgi:hypothetical protein